jgi:DNA polymerase-3 subunit alpha
MGQDDLFGGHEMPESDTASLPETPAWTAIEMLAAEKKTLGFYITGHPLDDNLETINRLGAVTSAELGQQETGSRATAAGVVRSLQLKTTKKGDRFAIFSLEDQAGSIKCVLWPEPYRRNSSVLAEEATLLINGRVELGDEGPATIIIDKLSELTQAVQQKAREVVIQFADQAPDLARYDEVKKLLETSPGDCDVFIELKLDNMTVRVRAHPSLKIEGSAKIETNLRNLGCEVMWEGLASPGRAAAAASN